MSELTKEWLSQKIAAMEAARNEIPFGLDEDDSNTLAALRIALASLEAEPVEVTFAMAMDFHHALNDGGIGNDDIEDIMIGLRAAFANITAPSAPVSVPDAMDDQEVFAARFRTRMDGTPAAPPCFRVPKTPSRQPLCRPRQNWIIHQKRRVAHRHKSG